MGTDMAEKRPDEPTTPPGAPAPDSDEDSPDEGANAPFGWVSLLIIVTLAVGTWFLVEKLSANAKLQDCVQSGRRNCAPIDDRP
jgi:hypothetical protein